VRSASGSERLCRAITNTMLYPATRVSCASFGGAYADCGEASWFVAVNAHGWGGAVSTHCWTGGFRNPRVLHAYPDKRFDAIHPR
jgi:hypothetical protein